MVRQHTNAPPKAQADSEWITLREFYKSALDRRLVKINPIGDA